MRHQGRTVDHEVAAIASRAHGVVGRDELIGVGLSPAWIRHRLNAGTLIKKYRGVYRVGHQAPSMEADYLAAVKACGGGAVLTGRAAGYLLGILKGPRPAPEVTTRTERRVRGIRIRRCRGLDPREVTTVRGIPVTTVPRTLVDLAALLPIGDLARAVHEAQVRYRTRPAQVEAVLARRPNAPGRANLREVLRGDVRVTLSKLERAFLRLLREAGLPLPGTNRHVDGYWVDCRWPDYKLTVELDSYQYHHTRYAWERDHQRERRARKRGDDYRRFTYGDVTETPEYVLAELRPLLQPDHPA